MSTGPAADWPPDGAALLDAWQPISLLANDLNRAIGMPDASPFVVTQPVRDKIGFISREARRLAQDRGAGPE